MSPTRPALRWLLRLLSAPELLRLIVAARNGQPPPYSVAHAWESLSPAGDWSRESKQEAEAILRHWPVLDESKACEAWAALLRGLRQLEDEARIALADLSRYAGLPQLFQRVKPLPPQGSTPVGPSLAELHAHLRGSVPFEAMWGGWMRDVRWRAAVRRGHRVGQATFSWSWAELLTIAAGCWRTLGQPDLTAELVTRTLVADTESREYQSGVTLLAIANVLRVASSFRRGDDRGEAGLANFQEAYDRYSAAQKSGRADRDQIASLVAATLRRFSDDGVQVVELRPTLERRPADLARRLNSLIQGYLHHLQDNPQSTLVFGIVPSLYKQEPAGEGPGAEQRRTRIWEQQVGHLLGLLEKNALLRWFVVGLDAAGGERGCPPRTLQAPFQVLARWHHAHGAPASPGVALPVAQIRATITDLPPAIAVQRLANAASRDPLFSPGWPRLGRTVHAGEDFADPLTGLRHIDEALRSLSLGRGDRVGHALAAGLDDRLLTQLLDRRATSSKGVRRVQEGAWDVDKPVGEHALDVSWLASRIDGADQSWAIAELGRCMGQAWSDPAVIDSLVGVFNGAGDDLTLPGLHYVREAPRGGQLTVRLDAAWRRRFFAARQTVLQEIRARRVVVESCPTSNMVVANLNSPPVGALLEELGPEQVVICTDDAGLFGAWTRDELQHAGVHRDAVIDTAHRAAFTRRDQKF